MSVLPPAITALQELGLNLTEARIYLSLLIESPANGHQISRNAGVPSAKVYENLTRLQQQGLVAAAANDNGYVPLPLDDLLEGRTARLKAAGETLRSSVEQGRHMEGDVLWHGSGYDVLLNRANSIIDEARNDILLSAWPEEFERLLVHLCKVPPAGVELSVILFADPEECRHLGERCAAMGRKLHLFPHAMLQTTQDRYAQQLALVVDGATALLMDGSGGGWRGVWTDHPALTRGIANYIRHDIYLNKLHFDLAPALKERYGTHLADLLSVCKGGVMD